MKKDYQTKAAPAATTGLVIPDAVRVAMGELTETVKEGCWRWPWGRAAGHAGDERLSRSS